MVESSKARAGSKSPAVCRAAKMAWAARSGTPASTRAAPTHVKGVPRTVDRRQITPRTARACAEEHRFARLAIGHLLGKALFAMRPRENRFNLLPLLLAKPVKPAVVGRRHHSMVHPGKIIDVTFGFNLIVNTA